MNDSPEMRARAELRRWKPNVGEFFHSPVVEDAAVRAMLAFAQSGMSMFTQEAYAAAHQETDRLSRELDITNADHVALWLERNLGDASLGWLAVRIVEAHEAVTPPAFAQSPEQQVEGMVLVPRAPTEAMIAAHDEAHAAAETVFAHPAAVWSAMLASAPPIPDVQDGGEWITAAEMRATCAAIVRNRKRDMNDPRNQHCHHENQKFEALARAIEGLPA